MSSPTESDTLIEVPHDVDTTRLIRTCDLHRTIDSRHTKQSEIFKAVVAFLLMNIAFCLMAVALALTHDRLPDRNIYKPLPDVMLDNVESVDFLFVVSELQIAAAIFVCILLAIFHRHRFVIARRCFFLIGILYLYRGVCFYVTVLPIPSRSYVCSPKSDSSAYEIIRRALSIINGMGLSIGSKQVVCGDSIFSGHATILILSALIVNEYSPKSFWPLRLIATLNSFIGIICIVFSHIHYTIDVIIAYYVTTRLFWTYHSLCHSNRSQNDDYIAREWWIGLFNYFESDRPKIQNQFEIPISFRRLKRLGKVFSRINSKAR